MTAMKKGLTSPRGSRLSFCVGHDVCSGKRKKDMGQRNLGVQRHREVASHRT
jgi:hypothetical protein